MPLIRDKTWIFLGGFLSDNEGNDDDSAKLNWFSKYMFYLAMTSEKKEVFAVQSSSISRSAPNTPLTKTSRAFLDHTPITQVQFGEQVYLHPL